MMSIYPFALASVYISAVVFCLPFETAGTASLRLPDTWGIPDDQANKVREALSKKSIRPEDAVQKALEELARDIAIIEPDPKDWAGWVTHLLEQLEIQSEQRSIESQYQELLVVLVGKIENRIKGGKW